MKKNANDCQCKKNYVVGNFSVPTWRKFNFSNCPRPYLVPGVEMTFILLSRNSARQIISSQMKASIRVLYTTRRTHAAFSLYLADSGGVVSSSIAARVTSSHQRQKYAKMEHEPRKINLLQKILLKKTRRLIQLHRTRTYENTEGNQ